MIIRLNGILLSDPTTPEDKKNWLEQGWDELNRFSEWFIHQESNLIVKPAAHSFYDWIVQLNHAIVNILPEFITFVVCILVSIGMFGSFGKWLARAVLTFLGGVVWISLSSASA